MKYSSLLITVLLVTCHAGAASHQRYANLTNPTQYLFSVPKAKIVEMLREIHGPKSWGPLSGAYFEDKAIYGMDVYDFYTKRYWTGREEKREDVDPPEAGRIGTIQADFEVHLLSKDDNQTLVSVSVKSFTQQVGRRYKIFPHFTKAPVDIDVKSDTYFEYLFLIKLGELLGEKDMPPIKDDPKGARVES